MPARTRSAMSAVAMVSLEQEVVEALGACAAMTDRT
jgi:hypothetical protein